MAYLPLPRCLSANFPENKLKIRNYFNCKILPKSGSQLKKSIILGGGWGEFDQGPLITGIKYTLKIFKVQF